MKVGYARVSTEDHNLYMQEDALKSVGCEEIFTDIASGSKSQKVTYDYSKKFAKTNIKIKISITLASDKNDS